MSHSFDINDNNNNNVDMLLIYPFFFLFFFIMLMICLIRLKNNNNVISPQVSDNDSETIIIECLPKYEPTTLPPDYSIV